MLIPGMLPRAALAEPGWDWSPRLYTGAIHRTPTDMHQGAVGNRVSQDVSEMPFPMGVPPSSRSVMSLARMPYLRISSWKFGR